jgi:hypothetical protein
LSVAAYRGIVRLYPRSFRDHWGEQAVLLFAELNRQEPPRGVTTLTLWTDNLPDLAYGLFAEWWRELARLPPTWRHALAHGTLAGVLLSTTTVVGNMGQLWSNPAGRATSWLIIATALTVLALAGRSTIAASGSIKHACRTGLFSGLIAFTLVNLTATVIVAVCFEHLSHDPLQLAAFAASHEPDFRTYQAHDLLGGWLYGTAAGTIFGALGACVAATVQRISHVSGSGRRI